MRAKLCLRGAPATLASLAVILALAVVGVMVLSGGGALASHVGCGDKITTDTRLDSDLVDCPNNGIVIAADGVTLNLNGHTIDGDGKPFAACPRRKFCDIGVVSVGHDGVAVRSGSVRQFDAGVLVGNARRARLMGLSSSRNRFFGFVVADSARSLIRNSSGSGSTHGTEGTGMGLFSSHHVRIVDSSFRNNHDGLRVLDSTHNLIKGNLSSHNQIGIELEGNLRQANRNQVRGNLLVRDRGVAAIIVAGGNRNVIARNRVHRAVGGIAVEVGRGNLVANNVVVGTRRTGIRLGLNQSPFRGGSNVLRRNLVRGGGDNGFLVLPNDDHSLLRRNLAVGAGDDGFDVRSRTTKLSRNRAVRNADLGIEAVRGVTDGGGNVARRNGDPRQCTNIACS
jgi:hypothetical protein